VLKQQKKTQMKAAEAHMAAEEPHRKLQKLQPVESAIEN
jgi:hypothetical protein